MNNVLNNNRLTAVIMGGVFMLVASVLINFVKDDK
jgi:hypothetical protein